MENHNQQDLDLKMVEHAFEHTRIASLKNESTINSTCSKLEKLYNEMNQLQDNKRLHEAIESLEHISSI